MAQKTDIIRCPHCGGRDVRQSHSRNLLDAVLALVHRHPMRCRQCRRRFYRFERVEPNARAPEAKPHQSKID